jgi:hypothetical protein
MTNKDLSSLVPVVTLGDGETWDTARNSVVNFITWQGEEQLYSKDSVDEQHIVETVSIYDLIQCYIKNKGV